MTNEIGKRFVHLENRLADQLLQLNYPENVEYIYNPLSYASSPHLDYVEKYANDIPKPVLFLGMNPGPWGMAQTGVPFGEIQHVKNWLGICSEVDKPAKEHPKKPIKGFNCTRREVSGERFWSFFSNTCQMPEVFFKNCIVYNHCPLVYMNKTGKNLTPPDLKIHSRNQVLSLCDQTLKAVIELYMVKHIVGIGRFAEARAKKVLQINKIENVKVHFMIHPSPASPIANKGWGASAQEALIKANIYNIVQGN